MTSNSSSGKVTMPDTELQKVITFSDSVISVSGFTRGEHTFQSRIPTNASDFQPEDWKEPLKFDPEAIVRIYGGATDT